MGAIRNKQIRRKEVEKFFLRVLLTGGRKYSLEFFTRKSAIHQAKQICNSGEVVSITLDSKTEKTIVYHRNAQ